jgi:hypothetical protein
MDPPTIISIAALIFSAASTIWVGRFRFSALLHEVKSLGVRIDKLEERMERRMEKFEARMDKFEARMADFQIEMHKFDIRVNAMEQRKT